MSSRAAKRRHRRSQRENVANAFLRSRARTARKRVLKEIDDNLENAQLHARQFNSFIDRVAKKGGLHRRTAARLKSRLASKIASASTS